MKRLLLVVVLLAFSGTGWSAATVPETYINHAWVKGVYWNQSALPGWGFFVDIQEELLFGAVYGYEGSNSTFIILQGKVTSSLPLTFKGDVYAVSGGGTTTTDVGNFTWTVEDYQASPSANLTISSNILNRSNLKLIRFVYAEDDKVDMFTGADWNIVRRILGVSFGDHYAISDDRMTEDGTTFAMVVDNADDDKVGVIGYYSDSNGYAYGMLVQFTNSSNVFYIFVANDIAMFGRYWLLDEGEDPKGNGSYFHGGADTMQASNQSLLTGQTSGFKTEANSALSQTDLQEDQHRLEFLNQDGTEPELDEMFTDELVQNVYRKTLQIYRSRVVGNE